MNTIPIPSSVTYHCSVCGKEVIEWAVSPRECILCLKQLCPGCEKTQLCPEHYNQLSPQQRRNLGLHTVVLRWLQSRLNVYGWGKFFLKMGLLLTPLFGIMAIFSNYSNPIAVSIEILLIISLIGLEVFGWISLYLKSRNTTHTLTRINDGIYSLLAPYAADGTPNKLPLFSSQEKSYNTGHSKHDSLEEIKQFPVEIPPELQAKALKDFTGMNESYNCGICGAKVDVTGGMRKKMYCHACYLRLCPQCNQSGLCTKDYARLGPQQQSSVQNCYDDQHRILVRVNRWYSLPIIPISFLIHLLWVGPIITQVSVELGVGLFVGGLGSIIFFAMCRFMFRQELPKLERTIQTMDTVVQQFIYAFNLPAPVSVPDNTLQTQKTLFKGPSAGHDQPPETVVCCPTCHVAHPAFAEYCMKCGKRLPLSNEPVKNP